MTRDQVRELHYITPIANLESVLARGILSHRRAMDVPHESIAADVIQDRRREKRVPGGLALHDYVNLYFDARNPMMYQRRTRHLTLCVLRVGADILDTPGAVISDGNAASDYARFETSPEGLGMLDRELVFARDWWDENRISYYRKKSARCAEVLVPHVAPTAALIGAYVSSAESLQLVRGFGLDVSESPDIFFA